MTLLAASSQMIEQFLPCNCM